MRLSYFNFILIIFFFYLELRFGVQEVLYTYFASHFRFLYDCFCTYLLIYVIYFLCQIVKLCFHLLCLNFEVLDSLSSLACAPFLSRVCLSSGLLMRNAMPSLVGVYTLFLSVQACGFTHVLRSCLFLWVVVARLLVWEGFSVSCSMWDSDICG